MALDPKALYEQGLKKDYTDKIQRNVEDVLYFLNRGSLDRKIQNFCTKYRDCVDLEQVKNSIRNDPVVRCF